MEFDKEKSNNKEYVLEMVKKQGSLLDYASDELKNDKENPLVPVFDFVFQFSSKGCGLQYYLRLGRRIPVRIHEHDLLCGLNQYDAYFNEDW